MFRTMNSNDLSYHAGASENARIVEDEDFPVVIVIDGDRIEVYWTDDELDAHNFYKISKMADSIGIGLWSIIKNWNSCGMDHRFIQGAMPTLLEDIGFCRI